ncbi:surface protein [Flagellimonas meridianipacifica]|uniref:Surface protein n=2 Tax=Flagellimonas meridianipacifica TaxID=1080225 RepID=A0A2T0MAR7_9FLAO|nr:surface protein [Allomuricauda pacifica]
MKLKFLFSSIFLGLLILSCSDDNEEVGRGIPEINPQTFEVLESVTDSELIGTVQADDPNGDALSLRIALDKSNLFEMKNNGDFGLIEGETLDFETTKEHQFTIRVTDGKGEFFNSVTVVVQDVNEPPLIEEQGFQTIESISETDIIGTVQATDPENDSITFEISENDNDLFDITENGNLVLQTGQNLDFETSEEHIIIVAVSDGINEPVEAQITITVTNDSDTLAEQPESFITTWEIPSNNFELVIGTNENYNYDFTIDWGDGTVEEINVMNPENFTHTYDVADTYVVAIQGEFPAINMFNSFEDSRLALKGINQWGDIEWQTMNSAFYFCALLDEYTAVDIPNLEAVTDMNRMFLQAVSFNAEIGNWDVSKVQDMGFMFFFAASFNGNIGDWKVDNVQNMQDMFFGAEAFNRDISGWITVSATNMSGMFHGADSFNQDLNNWHVDNVSDMSEMFRSAFQFNQDLSEWNTENVTNMSRMFQDAASFDQNLGGWDIGSIVQDGFGTGMQNMFDDSGMTPSSANATLIGWSNYVGLNGVPTDVSCGMDGITICGLAADAAGAFLANDNGWSFPGIINIFICP